METTNVKAIKAIYEAFSKGDIPFILNQLNPNVSFEFEAPSIIPYSGVQHGVEQVAGFFEGIVDSETDMKLVMNQYVDNGNIVASFGRYTTTVKSSKKRISTPVAHLWELENGRISRFVNYSNSAARADAA